MSTRFSLRRLALALGLCAVVTVGVVSTTPVLADCGNHNSGGGCKQAYTKPTASPTLYELLVEVFEGLIY